MFTSSILSTKIQQPYDIKPNISSKRKIQCFVTIISLKKTKGRWARSFTWGTIGIIKLG